MSNRPSHYSEYPQHHAHDHGRPPARRPAPAKMVAKPPGPQNGYTIAHAGKQVRIRPVLFWIAVGTVTALGVWSAGTATYFAFRDDVLTRLIARQAASPNCAPRSIAPPVASCSIRSSSTRSLTR
jgi:hypothetical protein